MSEDLHPAQELATLVADLHQLAEAWQGVGAKLMPWEDVGPGWPAAEPEPEPEAGPSTDPSPLHRSPQVPPAPGPAAPVPLFPQQQARPRPVPPRKRDPARPGRWSGYGAVVDPAEQMAKVRDQLGLCVRCDLHRGRKHIVFGVGDPRSRLVIVGEAPGFHEDQQGEPFVGPAGEMLDRMIENVLGSSRESVYIMNVLKCRPPENRDPEPGEVAACREFFDAQLNVIRPKAILALGRYAAQSLLDSTRGIKALRGQWGDYRGIPVMPTFHPAYLLRQPQDKRLTLEDLLALKRRLASEG